MIPSSKPVSEELFRQLESPRDAAPIGCRRPAVSGQPGSWRVITADGSTSVGELTQRAAASSGGRSSQAQPEVVLRHEGKGGRPTTIKLRGADGAHVSLEELELVDTEAKRPAVGLSQASDHAPKIGMPRPAALLDGDFAPTVLPTVRSVSDAGPSLFDPPPGPKAKAARRRARPTATSPLAPSLAPRPGSALSDGRSLESSNALGLPNVSLGSPPRPLGSSDDSFGPTLAMFSLDDRIVDPNGIDLDLVRVTDAWPSLPRRLRDAILSLIDAV